MNDAPIAQRSRAPAPPGVEVAVLYNVDSLDAGPEADPCFELRETVSALAREIAEALASDRRHITRLLAVDGDFAELGASLEAARPACVFNLCESLAGDARLETALPTLLELMGIPFTGSPAAALSAALYKDRVKRLLVRAGVPTPAGAVLTTPSEPCEVPLPAIVKPAREDGSAGIWARSVVTDRASLRERIAEVLGLFQGPCLVEQYVEGREFNVALLGFPEARVLPLQEIDFSALPAGHPRIVSYRAKWSPGSPEDLGTRPVLHPELAPELAARVRRAATDAWRAVGGRDYGRVDVRVDAAGVPYVVDINPNCDLSADAGFARAARAVGIDYPALLRLLVGYALRRRRGLARRGEPRATRSGKAR
ncbi:MAG TPA: D-alanine--D-alanine ligase [Polyangiaceae bacterium]|nr:D-alanine--D-alanine ligase [Polyangiaceae bacterium]